MWGSGDYAMRVWLDPRKVAERNLSAGDVVRAIRGENVQAAVGVVGASPAPDRTDLQLSVNAQGRLRARRSSATSSSRPSATAPSRCATWRIELGAAEYALRSLLDNKPAVAIGIFARRARTRDPDLGQRAQTMAEIKAMPDVDYEIVYDPTQFVRASIKAVVEPCWRRPRWSCWW